MAGRPSAKIDWNVVDKYLQAGCLGTNVAGLLGIHPNTLYESCKKIHKCNLSEYSAKKKAEGNELLRMVQYEAATEDKDKAMMIWLGKNNLGQKDRNDITSGNKPLAMNINVGSEASKRAIEGIDEALSE